MFVSLSFYKMKFITPLLVILLLFSCKRDQLVVTPPNSNPVPKIVYDSKILLYPNATNPYSKNYIISANSQFLVLNASSRWFGNDYVDVTHCWYNELLNENCSFTENQYIYGQTTAACENNGNVFCFDRGYQTSAIKRIQGCNFGGEVYVKDDKGSVFTDEINFLKLTQKGNLIVEFNKDSLYCMDILGSIKWRISSSGVKLSNLHDVCETASGDFLILGGSHTSASADDFCVTRLNKNGDVVWQKLYGGDLNDLPEQILYYNDQQIFLIGSSNSFGTNANNREYIIHVNADGAMFQQKTFGESLHSGMQCGKVYKDKLLISGYCNSDMNSKGQVFVKLLDQDLNILQHAESPTTSEHFTTSCALVNNSFAVCGNGFVMRFLLQY